MKFGYNTGRLLLIIFLAFKAIRQSQAPINWEENMSKLLNHEVISKNIQTYGKYIGYIELIFSSFIWVQAPLLPVIGSSILLWETFVFLDWHKDVYEMIVNIGIAGMIYMMAFSLPVFKATRKMYTEPEPKNYKKLKR